MEAKDIILSSEAIAAIKALQHDNGTYTFYANTLKRLFNFVFDQSDEIGMSDTEAISTLRALRYMQEDLACIANRKTQTADITDTEKNSETTEKVESAFSGMNFDPEDENDENEQ